jgi:hypothetical protein
VTGTHTRGRGHTIEVQALAGDRSGVWIMWPHVRGVAFVRWLRGRIYWDRWIS